MLEVCYACHVTLLICSKIKQDCFVYVHGASEGSANNFDTCDKECFCFRFENMLGDTFIFSLNWNG